jgi:hypothetical protein
VLHIRCMTGEWVGFKTFESNATVSTCTGAEEQGPKTQIPSTLDLPHGPRVSRWLIAHRVPLALTIEGSSGSGFERHRGRLTS